MTQATADPAITHANWFETFFEGIPVESWRSVLKNFPIAAEAAYIERQLGCRPGAAILDIPCGSGQYAIELARKGHRVTGYDLSRDSIHHAKELARADRLDIDFRLADMRAVAGRFDGAFCWGNSFGYMPDDGNRQFLRAVRNVLQPGSRFVLQTGICAEALLPVLKTEAAYELDGVRFVIRNAYDPRHSVLQTHYEFSRDGKTETRRGWQCVYTCGELCRMFEHAGFDVIDLHQNTAGDPFNIGGRWLILTVARAG